MGHGFMMAPIIGKLYGEWLARGHKHPIFDRCRLARFAEGAIEKEDFIIG
jgi:sarcosine oxidase subunit beta